MSNNYGLGRGLASLIPQKKAVKTEDKTNKTAEYSGESATRFRSGAESRNEASSMSGIQEVEIAKIIPNPHQPRTEFNGDKLTELAESIKNHGIIQPLVVSRVTNGFELIAGERRLQASKLAGLLKVPVIIRSVSDKEKLELAIVENIHRHDLNVIEEAKAYKKLGDDFQMSQDEIALKVGKSRSAITNKIRLLQLPVEIKKAIIEGKITEGHAKAILAIESSEKQRALFELILKNSLTVRQVEEKTKEISVRTHKRTVSVDPEIKDLEGRLMGIFGTKVKVTKSGAGGKIILDYYSKEELDGILGRILKNEV